MLVGGALVATIGVTIASGVVGQPPRQPDLPTSPGSIRQPPTVSSTPAVATRAVPTPTPETTVTLTLASFDREPSLGGVSVTIDVVNGRPSPVSFAFDPSYDLRLVDARGSSWPLRWAEYTGTLTVSASSSARLVRAFFAGPVGVDTVWPLTLAADRTPAGRTVEWHVSQHGLPTPVVDRSTMPLPPTPSPGPIVLQLTDPRPSSALGGVQVDLTIQNSRPNDLIFQFDPSAQLTAVDNLDRPYHVRWAQYQGIVHVGPHQSGRLARVFFEGPVSDGRSAWLKVELHQVPGGSVLRGIIAIE